MSRVLSKIFWKGGRLVPSSAECGSLICWTDTPVHINYCQSEGGKTIPLRKKLMARFLHSQMISTRDLST